MVLVLGGNETVACEAFGLFAAGKPSLADTDTLAVQGVRTN